MIHSPFDEDYEQNNDEDFNFDTNHNLYGWDVNEAVLDPFEEDLEKNLEAMTLAEKIQHSFQNLWSTQSKNVKMSTESDTDSHRQLRNKKNKNKPHLNHQSRESSSTTPISPSTTTTTTTTTTTENINPK